MELPNSVTEPDVAERIQKFYKEIAIPPESIANTVAFAIGQPEDVDVNEILSLRLARNYEALTAMSHSRRTFLVTAGTVLASPAICRIHGEESLATTQEPKMDITRIGSVSSAKGPAEWFTGTVRIDRLFPVHEPARAAGASVTFEPGARTAWHTHPLGQTLIVTDGCGWVQREGGPVVEVHPGDVVWFPPGEKHWHGATATTAMTHIAIQEQLDGKVVDWLEHVSDEQYRA
jgi:quercetin dioxygenase-like cupin family protein